MTDKDYSSELDEILENAPGMGWGGAGNLENCKAKLSALLRRVEVEGRIDQMHVEADAHRIAGGKGLPLTFQTRMNKLQAELKELEAEL